MGAFNGAHISFEASKWDFLACKNIKKFTRLIDCLLKHWFIILI